MYSISHFLFLFASIGYKPINSYIDYFSNSTMRLNI